MYYLPHTRGPVTHSTSNLVTPFNDKQAVRGLSRVSDIAALGLSKLTTPIKNTAGKTILGIKNWYYRPVANAMQNSLKTELASRVVNRTGVPAAQNIRDIASEIEDFVKPIMSPNVTPYAQLKKYKAINANAKVYPIGKHPLDSYVFRDTVRIGNMVYEPLLVPHHYARRLVEDSAASIRPTIEDLLKKRALKVAIGTAAVPTTAAAAALAYNNF